MIKRSLKFFSTLEKHYDIVISGCGVAGASLALALCQTQIKPKILILDIHEPAKKDKIISSDIPDHRVVTLNKASINFLSSLKAFPFLAPERVKEFKEMVVWESKGKNFFIVDDPDHVAKVVEIQNIQASVVDCLSGFPNVQFSIPNSISTLNTNSHSNEISLSNGENLECQLVIGSDGLQSKVKKEAGISNYGWMHSQYGIVCTLEAEEIEGSKKAWQRFLPSGPLGILPLWGNYYSIVWSVPLEEHSYLMELDEGEFLKKLNVSLNRESELNFIGFNFSHNMTAPPLFKKLANKRLSFPLSNMQANEYVKHRVALIGDAAHTIHPMAGQGLNLGILDASILANELTKSLRAGNDLGDELFLSKYQQKAKINNYAMSAVVEFVKNLYSLESSPLAVLRNIGTGGIQNFPFIKQQMSHFASGTYFSEPYEWEKL